ncbi:MAG: cbb3-type cytochrome c oxidase subunit I [Planctomycetota bacterium]|nr:cbb3-type cytochrome c oxidase subunit I [Planctomycetota bacterium]
MSDTTNSSSRTAKPASAATASTGEMWLFTLDHRRLARAWAAVTAVVLVAGVVLGLGLAFQPLADAGAVETFRRMYTMHGLALVALVVLPAIPGVLGNALLPESCGVEGMAWPGLNRLAFHIHLFGVALFLVAFSVAPADTGWSFDAPFAFGSASSLAWSVAGLLTVGVASACSGANLVATFVESRLKNRGNLDVPLFAWALAAGGLVQVLAAPFLCVAAVLLVAQRAGAADVFASGVAIDVSYAQWFWAWAHPAMGAAVIAALGLVDDVVTRHAGGRAPASRSLVLCILALAVLAFAGSPVHWIGRTNSPADSLSASALALAAGVPFAGLVAGWIATLGSASPRPTGALCAAATAIVLFTCGALAGLFAASVPAGALLQQSSFASAQLHFSGLGVVAALYAGLLQVSPDWFGVPVREGQGRGASALILAGTLATFVPKLVLGAQGQPSRTLEILAGGEALTLASAVGGIVLALGLGLAAWSIVGAFLASHGASNTAAEVAP